MSEQLMPVREAVAGRPARENLQGTRSEVIAVGNTSLRQPRIGFHARTPAVGWAEPVRGPVRCRWQYCTLQADGSVVTAVDGNADASLVGTNLAQALNVLGVGEWELVGVSDDGAGRLYVFKRPGPWRSGPQ